MDCAALLPAHEVIPFFSWNRLTYHDWAKFGAGLLPEHCLPASYLIAQSIWNHAKNTQSAAGKKGSEWTSRESSSLPGERPSAWWGDAEGRITCTLLYHHPIPKHTPSLFLRDKCVIKVKLQLLFFNTTCFVLPSKKDIWLKGNGCLILTVMTVLHLHTTSLTGFVKVVPQFIWNIFLFLWLKIMCHNSLESWRHFGMYMLVMRHSHWQCETLCG